jgi:hypothetical protein
MEASTSENDFECLARTRVTAPATIFPKLSDGCQTRPVRPTTLADRIRDWSALMVGRAAAPGIGLRSRAANFG